MFKTINLFQNFRIHWLITQVCKLNIHVLLLLAFDWTKKIVINQSEFVIRHFLGIKNCSAASQPSRPTSPSDPSDSTRLYFFAEPSKSIKSTLFFQSRHKTYSKTLPFSSFFSVNMSWHNQVCSILNPPSSVAVARYSIFIHYQLFFSNFKMCLLILVLETIEQSIDTALVKG